MNYKDKLKDGPIVDCISNLFRSIHRVIFVIYRFIVYSVKKNFVLRFKNRNISIHLRIKILYTYFFGLFVIISSKRYDVRNVIHINFTTYKFYIFWFDYLVISLLVRTRENYATYKHLYLCIFLIT